MAEAALQDAWISVILATLLAIPFVVLSVTLMLKFPQQSLAEITQEVFGNLPGRVIGFIYSVAFFV